MFNLILPESIVSVKSFNDINKMVVAYKNSPSKDDAKLKSLTYIGFMALIYNLDTGRFGIEGFGESSFLRYFVTSGGTNEENWAMDIINNLQYGKGAFINLL